MSAARIRSALAPELKALGFSRRGSEFVLRQSDLEHAVSVFAVRRLTGYFEVLHSVLEAESSSPRAAGRAPLIQDRIQGFTEPYLGLWSSEKFDPSLAAKQTGAIVSAFSSLSDVAHFYSDRPMPHGASAVFTSAASAAPNSLSKAQTETFLRHHSRAVFAGPFAAVPRLGDGFWAHCKEVGGYRYCAYLLATGAATFATILYFRFASTDIAKGRKSDDVLRLLFGAPKRLLSDEGRPVLIPLTAESFDYPRVSEVLLRLLEDDPPNGLPR